MIFGFLWVSYFIDAFNTFTVASSAAIWYFSDKDPHSEDLKEKKCKRAVCKSMYRIFRYHLGTLAFGSFLLAVIQMARLILWYIMR